MTTPPPPPSSFSSSGGTPTPPGADPAWPSSTPAGGGARPVSWWTTGRVIAAIIIVLGLMGLSAFGGFVAGAAFNVGDVLEGVAGDPTGPTASGTALRVGTSVTGTLLDNGAVEHPLVVESARDVRITVRSEDFDTVLTVLEEDGTEIDRNDDMELGDQDSRLELDLAAGTYMVRVTAFGFGSGDYTVEVD